MLELYVNIKNFRKARHLSQEELAKKVGYTDRSSIAKIEKGEVDLPQSKIMLLAAALDVEPGTLMGSTGVLPSPAPDLRSDEQELLQSYNSLNREGREKVRGYADDLKVSGRYIKSDPDPMVDTA